MLISKRYTSFELDYFRLLFIGMAIAHLLTDTFAGKNVNILYGLAFLLTLERWTIIDTIKNSYYSEYRILFIPLGFFKSHTYKLKKIEIGSSSSYRAGSIYHSALLGISLDDQVSNETTIHSSMLEVLANFLGLKLAKKLKCPLSKKDTHLTVDDVQKTEKLFISNKLESAFGIFLYLILYMGIILIFWALFATSGKT